MSDVTEDLMAMRPGMAIKRAEQALIAEKTRVLREFGLTVPQYAALLSLVSTPQASAAQLARECLVTPQSMATVLTNLEAKGLVGREVSPMHQRLKETRLTDAGRAVFEQADRAAVAVEGRLVAAFTDEELRAFREYLERAALALAPTEG